EWSTCPLLYIRKAKERHNTSEAARAAYFRNGQCLARLTRWGSTRGSPFILSNIEPSVQPCESSDGEVGSSSQTSSHACRKSSSFSKDRIFARSASDASFA